MSFLSAALAYITDRFRGRRQESAVIIEPQPKATAEMVLEQPRGLGLPPVLPSGQRQPEFQASDEKHVISDVGEVERPSTTSVPQPTTAPQDVGQPAEATAGSTIVRALEGAQPVLREPARAPMLPSTDPIFDERCVASTFALEQALKVKPRKPEIENPRMYDIENRFSEQLEHVRVAAVEFSNRKRERIVRKTSPISVTCVAVDMIAHDIGLTNAATITRSIEALVLYLPLCFPHRCEAASRGWKVLLQLRARGWVYW